MSQVGSNKENKRVLFLDGFHALKLSVFVAYIISYAIYMVGDAPRWLNLAMMMLFIFLCMLEYFKLHNLCFDRKGLFFQEFMTGEIIVVVFFCISFICQVIHGDIQKYLIIELLDLFIPPLFSFFWISTTKKEERFAYFVLWLIRAALYFILANIANFSFVNVIAISWFDSGSSVFEVPIAHDFFLLEIIFLYFRCIPLAAISMVLCMLSFKRVSFFLSATVMLLYFILQLGAENKKEKLMRPVSKKTSFFTVLGCCFVPFLLLIMVSERGVSFFSSLGLDLNRFTSGRVNLIHYVMKNMDYYNGFGSTDWFLAKSGKNLNSMHCDFLRMFLEVTEVGVMAFACCVVRIARKYRIVFLLLLYFLIELSVSHFLDVFSAWTLFYSFAACIEADQFEKYGRKKCEDRFNYLLL